MPVAKNKSTGGPGTGSTPPAQYTIYNTIYNISIISFHVGVVCISIMWQFWDRDIKTSSETCVGAKVIIGIRDACSTADISNGCSSGLLVVTKWSTSGHHVGTKWSPSCKWSPNGLLVVTSYSANGCWVDEFRKKITFHQFYFLTGALCIVAFHKSTFFIFINLSWCRHVWQCDWA